MRCRPPAFGDFWIGDAPTREQIEDRLGNDDEARAVLFDWSMAEFVEHYLRDERLQIAYLGQGVIGTNASPFDPGTASIRFHHASGRLGGMPGMWGYVRGGMGMVSFYFCDAAREAGATVVSGVPVAQILPGEGVVLEGGERIAAPTIVSNADPRQTLRLLGAAADSQWRAQVERVPIEGCTVKLNVHLRELPNFTARPGTNQPHHYGQINAPLTKDEWKAGFAAARRGELPRHLWCELYFQSVHDPSVVPAGQHTMSVFAQYVPYKFAHGTWDERRDEVRRLALNSLARFCSQHRHRRHRRPGARPARHRAESRPHRRPHLSGRMPAALYVGQPPHRAHPHARRLSLRSLHPSRRLRHRHQRPQRRHGSPCRHRQKLASQDLVSLPCALCYPPPYMPSAPALKRGLRFRDLCPSTS